MAAGLDGGYVRAAHKQGWFEVIAGKGVVAFGRDDAGEVPSAKCFGVQTYDEESRRRRFSRPKWLPFSPPPTLHLAPETEAKLNELARRTHRGADELVEQAIEHQVAYNEWFERKVKESQEAVARGETVPDEEVRAWLESRERR